MFTLTYDLENIIKKAKGLGIAGELNSGNNFRDTLRFGPTYEVSFNKGNYTLLKFFPFNTGKDKEVQFSIFFSQDFFDRLNYSTLFNYNLRPNTNTYYLEPQISLRFGERFRFFIEGRITGTIDDRIQTEYVIGLKFLLR